MLMLLKRLRKAALLCNLEITERGKGEKYVNVLLLGDSSYPRGMLCCVL